MDLYLGQHIIPCQSRQHDWERKKSQTSVCTSHKRREYLLTRPCHSYFSGNYAPIYTVQHAYPCEVQGTIPEEFLGGQYVRNGSNSLQDDDRRDLHWFDGDGMLSGVFFRRMSGSKVQQPLYSNRYILTDVHCATAEYPHISPIISSATTLLSPMVSPLKVFMGMLRTMALMLSSFLGFVVRPIRRISTANTNILYHDGRVLATMETGPPMRVYLPSLSTVGWFTGSSAEGEPPDETMGPSIGGPGIEGFHNEMTTAHVRLHLVITNGY